MKEVEGVLLCRYRGMSKWQECTVRRMEKESSVGVEVVAKEKEGNSKGEKNKQKRRRAQQNKTGNETHFVD